MEVEASLPFMAPAEARSFPRVYDSQTKDVAIAKRWHLYVKVTIHTVFDSCHGYIHRQSEPGAAPTCRCAQTGLRHTHLVEWLEYTTSLVRNEP
ncbi:hypothetical protein ACFU5B_21820 [Streptomyces murinus]|uniref:hypothetical protein n=1 Tax=Streptomyces murinus TaxID=33900 RepID=UPI0036261C1A